MHRTLIVILTIVTAWPVAAFADPSPGRRLRMGVVDLSSGVPEDLASPDGRTRWDLRSLTFRDARARVIDGGPSSVTIQDERSGAASPAEDGSPGAPVRDTRASARVDLIDGSGGDAALRWVLPERFAEMLRPGARDVLHLEETTGAGTDRLFIDVRTVGIGWLHLPSGPREVVLQRALVLRAREERSGYEPDRLVHRWVDPAVGVVAEVSGPVSPDGERRLSVDEAYATQEAAASAANLRIYVDELDEANFSTLAYGWDRGAGTAVSAVTTPSYANMGLLVAASSWDFSGNTSGTEVAATTTPISMSETCNYNQCGYTLPNSKLERRDRAFGTGSLTKFNSVRQREDRANDVVLWLRAGTQKEDVAGAFGTGESRFCYTGTFGNPPQNRSTVPEWVFSHPDPPPPAAPQRYYFQAGDAWQGGPFNCEQNLYNTRCGSGGFGILSSKACAADGGHAGTQTFNVIKGGVLTLPSGHTFNALLVRTVADFCVFLGIISPSDCTGSEASRVRTAVWLWQVPQLGTLARLQSEQNHPSPNVDTVATLAETDIKFGLFPPRTIQATASTDTTVSLSWDPGLDTHRISDYKVYWDVDSGGATPYAFNSVTHPGQVSFAGTTATISGLTPGTTYHFTVTSRSNYTDPTSTVPTTYESLLYPTQISGDPSFVYPVEVQRATTGGSCTPTAEVTDLMLAKAGSSVQFSWDPVVDPCLQGYRILGGGSPTSDANFSTVADTGLGTTITLATTQRFFLVVARGSGGTGPWGAYGH